MPKRYFRAGLVVCLASMMLVACTSRAAQSQGPGTDAEASASSLPAGTVLASYPGGNTIGSEIREQRARSDGYYHIDTQATIAELTKLHVNTYLFLVWHSPTDWQDLKGQFLAAAKQAGINVWVYIVPPSECSQTGWCSRPFGLDYKAWGGNIAKLSTQFSNLKAWAIDDFTAAENAKTFTSQYMKQIKQAVSATNPKLQLYTTAYYATATTDTFYEEYAPYINGIIFPYLDEPFHNTEVTSTLPTQLDAVRSHANRYKMQVLLMIYTGRFSSLEDPTADYVRRALKIAVNYARKGRIGGVVSYGTPHPQVPTVSSDNLAMYGLGSLVVQDYGHSTPPDTYASASQTVRVDPQARRYTVSFWRYNRYYSPRVPGRLMQVLVDDHVVWSSDIATDQSGGNHEYRWMEAEGPIEIDPSFLRGSSHATLTFRIYEAQAADYRSLTAFDSVKSSGFDVVDPGFESPGSWVTTSTYGNLIPSVRVYNPKLPAYVFDAVGAAFMS